MPIVEGRTGLPNQAAAKVYGNVRKGYYPFKPWMGTTACSWFVIDGNPHIGSKVVARTDVKLKANINIPAGTYNNPKGEDYLKEKFLAAAVKVRGGGLTWEQAETVAQSGYKQSSLLTKFNTQQHEMWMLVDADARQKPEGIIVVQFQDSVFSKNKNGKFAIVSNKGINRISMTEQQLQELRQELGYNARRVMRNIEQKTGTAKDITVVFGSSYRKKAKQKDKNVNALIKHLKAHFGSSYRINPTVTSSKTGQGPRRRSDLTVKFTAASYFEAKQLARLVYAEIRGLQPVKLQAIETTLDPGDLFDTITLEWNDNIYALKDNGSFLGSSIENPATPLGYKKGVERGAPIGQSLFADNLINAN